MSGEYSRWSSTFQLSSNSFVEQSKTHEAANCHDKTRRSSNSLLLDVFVQLPSLIRLISFPNLLFDSLVEAHNAVFLSSPTKHRA